MKSPKAQDENPQPRNVQRSDMAPTTGYAIVVDGHLKTQFVEEAAAKKAATELLAKYPMLKVEIYDAASKARKPLDWGYYQLVAGPTLLAALRPLGDILAETASAFVSLSVATVDP